MCSLNSASQMQIKHFLESLMNKDVTRDTVQMAIKACELPAATVKSPVEVYQTTPKRSRRGKSKTPLQDFLNSPAAKEQRRYSEIKRLEVELQTERHARIYSEEQYEALKKEKERMETKKNDDIKRLQAKLGEIHVNVDGGSAEHLNTSSTDQHLKIIELREVIECLDEKCANLTDENYRLSEKVEFLSNQLSDWKLRSETLDANYFEAQQKIAKLSETVETFQKEQLENQNKMMTLKKELDCLQNSIHFERDSLKKEIEAKSEMQMNMKSLQEEFNSASQSYSTELEFHRNKIKDVETLLCEKMERELTLEKEIAMKEIMLVEKVKEMDEDLNEKQKAIDDLMKMQIEGNEKEALRKDVLEEQIKAAEVLKGKYTDLKLKYVEKAKECQNMKSIYEEKLSRLKEQMQTAYNKEKEKIVAQNKSGTNDLERNLQMYKEKFTQYHGDNVELRSRVWDLSEKLLKASDEKANLQKRLSSLMNQANFGVSGETSKFVLEQHSIDQRLFQYKRSNYRPQIDVMDVIDESVTYVRRQSKSSRKSIPPGIGQAFPPQDEEGEEFNAKYLADMKAGRCLIEAIEKGQLSEYQRRNSMVLPHLKSSYPVTDCKELLEATEDDVKFGIGSDLDNFDTLSTSLLLLDRKKNKDRGQTSYKKPGPPAPGKNGGRLSLQVSWTWRFISYFGF